MQKADILAHAYVRSCGIGLAVVALERQRTRSERTVHAHRPARQRQRRPGDKHPAVPTSGVGVKLAARRGRASPARTPLWRIRGSNGG